MTSMDIFGIYEGFWLIEIQNPFGGLRAGRPTVVFTGFSNKKLPPEAGVDVQVFRTNFSLHLGQVMAIFPFPLGTRTV